MKYENNKIIYEIGDWVVVLDPGEYWASIHIDEILQIKEIEELSIGQKLYFITTNQYVYSNVVRPATQQEIEEAIKKTEFKVGDWVYLYCSDTNNRYIFEVSNVTEEKYEIKQYYDITNNIFRKSTGCFYKDISKRTFRYATIDEIAKANLAGRKLSEVKIRGHKVERSENNSITIGCKTFNIDDINQVYRILDDYGISEVTLDELKKIRDFIYRD